MAGDPNTFPYDCVVLIEAPDPAEAGYYIQGSGVVIGPHTILTASHVVYDISAQEADQDIQLYPGWENADPVLGPGYISTTYTDHFNDIGTYGSDDLTKAQSASDYAVIDTSYTFSSWMDVDLNYSGGEVHLTGYPAIAGGYQTDQVGTVSADPSYSVLDYDPETLKPHPGNSGGPLWVDDNGSDDVVGLVSTSGWACQLTSADWSQIEAWVSADGYSLATSSTAYVAPVVTAVSGVSLAEGQVISASSLIASISNPGGDDITEDVYEDDGGGSGYFTVDGVRQADDVPITAGSSADVQYVAGSSPGSDTLSVGIYDSTTNSYIYASNSVVATTVQAEDSILWRDTSTGGLELWNSNGSGGFAYENFSAVKPSWQIAGTGDFTGNGQDDILWRNSSTAGVELWNSNGSGGFTYESLGVVNSSWQIEGTGDFAGDGDDGIVWRNSSTGGVELWNSNGSGGFTYDSLGVVDSSWQIEGTGDFTGNGEDGILWRNSSTGGAELWNPNGSGGFAYDSLGVVDSSWQIAGTGDFSGNGEDGILWRNSSTGGLELWNPNGSGGFAYENLGVVNSSWEIAGTGDFTGGGADSILWRNASTGGVELWNSNGSGGFAYENLGVVNSSWTIFGHL
jgi:V8-like Glu-specific endopeptidase